MREKQAKNNWERNTSENKNCERNASENNKTAVENMSENNNKNTIEQNKTRTTNKASIKYDTYLKNPPLIPWLGDDPFQKLSAKKSYHTNRTGMKATSLPLITKPSPPEISVISGWRPIRSSGFYLDETTTDPPVVHSNQETTTVAAWV